MKKFRKGFTLVELLVVIAILGALAAAMSTSVTGATAKAKAATIDGWAITVDFSEDPEKDAIVDELTNINGFKNSYATADATGTAIVTKNTAAAGQTSNGKYKFKVTLSSGKIEAFNEG